MLRKAAPEFRGRAFQKTSKGEIRVTPIRHASVMLGYGGVIHIDPWSQGNYTGLPKADLILSTDIHGDHMDPKAIEQVKKEGTKIYAPAAVQKPAAAAAVPFRNSLRSMALCSYA